MTFLIITRFFLNEESKLVQIEEFVFEVNNDMIDKFIITSFYEKGYYLRCFLFIIGLYSEENDFINYISAMKVSLILGFFNFLQYIKDNIFLYLSKFFFGIMERNLYSNLNFFHTICFILLYIYLMV